MYPLIPTHLLITHHTEGLTTAPLSAILFAKCLAIISQQCIIMPFSSRYLINRVMTSYKLVPGPNHAMLNKWNKQNFGLHASSFKNLDINHSSIKNYYNI